MQRTDDIQILPETESHYPGIEKLVRKSFATVEHSDGDEHLLIYRLRNTPEYIDALSLVAVSDGIPVGYIMFTRIHIGTVEGLALAPLAVAPDFQKQGIGSLLVNSGHELASQMKFRFSVVLGSPTYYTRFGYRPASYYNIHPPFAVDDKYFMVCSLTDKESLIPKGVVRYSEAFGL